MSNSSGPSQQPGDVSHDLLSDQPPSTSPQAISFADLGLSDELLATIQTIGWTQPTEVQHQSFARLQSAADLMVQSQTGTGKTAAFCLPWLASRFDPQDSLGIGVQLLVLVPTRELAKQVAGELERLAGQKPIRILAVYGGTPMAPQLKALAQGVHAVIGTPGRILDHLRRRSLKLPTVKTVVLDECDEMLSMGFLADIEEILEQCPPDRQTCLFSATIPNDIQRIAKRYMKHPELLQIAGAQVAHRDIEHVYYLVSNAVKTRDLLDVLMIEDPVRAIIFCNTREDTKLVTSVLNREGLQAEALSSDVTQSQRELVLQRMRDHHLRFLVATDVAARGIDITQISHVINYSFPESPETYIHRTGRTGRAGAQGIAISLISPRELADFYQLKLQHPDIQFQERALPSAEQLNVQRRENKLDTISHRLPEQVSPEWIALARALMEDPRSERIIGLLLHRAMRLPSPETVAERASAGEAEGDLRFQPRTSRRTHTQEEAKTSRHRSRTRKPPFTKSSESLLEEHSAAVSPVSQEKAVQAESISISDERKIGDEERPTKKRRRRRRSRFATEQVTESHPSQDIAPQSDDLQPENETPESPESFAKARPDRRQKRRKKLRRRSPSQPPLANPSQVSQEQIVIDIDEKELDIVRNEFGEIDELDELTLKGRRRAVIDTLHDEVEIEDIEVAELEPDLPQAKIDESTELESNPVVEVETVHETPPGGSQVVRKPTPAPKKQRKRPSLASVWSKQPELTVPPHKDFWEAWATRFSITDFDDSHFETETESTMPARPRKATKTSRTQKVKSQPLGEQNQQSNRSEHLQKNRENGKKQDDLVKLELNIGRRSGYKSAQIRELLKQQCDLEGHAIRDLTVLDTTTLFRTHSANYEQLTAKLSGLTIADIELRISRPDEVVPEPASVPEQISELSTSSPVEVQNYDASTLDNSEGNSVA